MITREAIPALADARSPVARLHLNSPHTYYGEPIASPMANDLKSQMDGSEVEEKFYFINHTHRPITVMKRDGLAMTIAHRNSYSSSDFIIRRVIRFRGLALESAIACMNTMEVYDSGHLDELKRCLCSLEYGKYSEATACLDYTVTLKDLQDKGGMIYHYQLDMAISLKDAVHAPPHPYSSRFVHIGGFGKVNEYAEQTELNLKMRLVDHSPVAEKKYISVAGKVFTLIPQKDAPYSTISSKINGKQVEKVYSDYLEIFYSAKNDPVVVDNAGVGHLRISIAEAKERFGLYDNYNDALNSGNIELTRKEHLTRLIHEAEVAKAENQRERARLENDDIQHKKELTIARQELETLQGSMAAEAAKQKQIQAQLDIQLQTLSNAEKALSMQRKTLDETLERERKEHQEKLTRMREEQTARIETEARHWREFYDMRSQVRKDTSDFVKFVPGLLLGVAGIAAAWMKFSQPAK